MRKKVSFSSSEKHHLWQRDPLIDDLRSVFLELESLTVEIPAEVMDQMAIDWIKKRKLQGAVGGPVGAEWGSPDCPWE